MGGSVYCEAARQIALKARGGAKRPKKKTGNQSANRKKSVGFTLFSQGLLLDEIHLDLCKHVCHYKHVCSSLIHYIRKFYLFNL